MAALLTLGIASVHKCQLKMPTRGGGHYHGVMDDGSGLSPIDAIDDCQGPANGIPYLSPDIRMTMGDVAPIICDDPVDDDGPLSGFSVSIFAGNQRPQRHDSRTTSSGRRLQQPPPRKSMTQLRCYRRLLFGASQGRTTTRLSWTRERATATAVQRAARPRR
jgi:hypothetical protein